MLCLWGTEFEDAVESLIYANGIAGVAGVPFLSRFPLHIVCGRSAELQLELHLCGKLRMPPRRA